MRHIPEQAMVFKIFHGITGLSLIVVMVGFGRCLFDIDQISACVDHGEYAFNVFKAVGDHIIKWFIALCEEVFSRV